MHQPAAVLEMPSDTPSSTGNTPTISSQSHQFRLLVTHLLDRFVNNEMLAVGGETLPFVMTVAGAIAVPTLIAAIFLFPSYHAFPPKPLIPNFWTQVCEHYFFVVYSMVSMGLITVFEADLFFPEPLDILVLSPLPIPPGRMAVARVAANLIFLVLLLVGTNVFTVMAYPPITELHVRRLFLANLAAVLSGAAFSAAVCLALQGMLSCVFTGSQYRRASVVLQCGVTVALISTFLSMPKLFPLLNQLTRHAHALWFPPLWFLGLYESILAAPAPLQQFVPLAHLAVWATAISMVAAALTFPLAYIRRSRQAIESSAAISPEGATRGIVEPVLHASLLRLPEQRAIYHFIGQSLRAPKHRIYLAMYAGLGLALMVSAIAVVQLRNGAITFSVDSAALQAIVPGVCFWTAAGLCSALASPADPRGGWVFPVTSGPPTSAQLDAVRLWVTVWAATITVAVVFIDATAFPHTVTGATYFGGLFIAIALSILLPDALLFQLRTIPFTEIRIPLNTDLAWILLRYIVLFPATIAAAIRIQPWIVRSPMHFVAGLIAVLVVHSAIREATHRALQRRSARSDVDELTGMLPGLGLNG